jgi:hypothetical protein
MPFCILQQRERKDFVLIARLGTIVQRIALVSVHVKTATKDITRQSAILNQKLT